MTRRRTRVIFYSLFLIPSLLAVFVGKVIPEDQDAAKLLALIEYPCPTREFFTSEVLILFADKNIIEGVVRFFPFGCAYISSFFLFQVSTLIYYICIAPSNTTSKDTQQKQKVFLICITFQTSCPMIIGMCPIILTFIAFLTGHYYQEMTNLTFCCLRLHGMAESNAIVFVHRPYRKAISQMIRDLKKRKSSIRVSPISVHGTSNSVTRG